MQSPQAAKQPQKAGHHHVQSTGKLVPQVVKYRTRLCKHYSNKGQCPLGERCSFAHGKVQVRTAKDPVPEEAINQAPYNNYKTTSCLNFTERGQCRYFEHCTFAHGGHELRNPYDRIDPATLQQQQYAQWFMAQQQAQPTPNPFVPLQQQHSAPLPNPFLPSQLYQPPSSLFGGFPTQSQVMSGAVSVPMFQQSAYVQPDPQAFQQQVARQLSKGANPETQAPAQ